MIEYIIIGMTNGYRTPKRKQTESRAVPSQRRESDYIKRVIAPAPIEPAQPTFNPLSHLTKEQEMVASAKSFVEKFDASKHSPVDSGQYTHLNKDYYNFGSGTKKDVFASSKKEYALIKKHKHKFFI